MLQRRDQTLFVYSSVYGKVESGWEKADNGWKFTVTVPANCTAAVCLPGEETVTVESGTYTF